MPIQISSFLKPRNNNTWFIVEDNFIKGGFQVVADVAARDAINPLNLKAGMVVVTQSDNKVYQLDSDAVTWNEFAVGNQPATGPVRQTLVFNGAPLLPQTSVDLVLPMGKTVLVHSLSVNCECQVEAFETAERTDTNPYLFISTLDHLTDDGSTLMSDGTILRGRRYTVLTNRETVPSQDQYFRITNPSSTTDTPGIVLTVDFLPLEL